MRYGASAILVLLLSGCLTGAKYEPTTRYVLQPEVAGTANTGASSATTSGKSLGIRRLEAARPYRQAIAYLDAGYVLGNYETAEWAELPSDTVTRALTDALAATGRFSDVGNAADMKVPDLILTGQVRRFEEVRTAEPWTAVCEVRLELRDGQNPVAVWSGTLSSSEPLERNDCSGLAAAMSKAVSKVVAEGVRAIMSK